MIDPASESLIRLSDIPKLNWLPVRKSGRRLHLSTVYRWQQRGLRGVRLETVQCGGTRCTTEAALVRFFESLGGPGSAQLTSGKRVAHLRRVERTLDQAGI